MSLECKSQYELDDSYPNWFNKQNKEVFYLLIDVDTDFILIYGFLLAGTYSTIFVIAS